MEGLNYFPGKGDLRESQSRNQARRKLSEDILSVAGFESATEPLVLVQWLLGETEWNACLAQSYQYSISHDQLRVDSGVLKSRSGTPNSASDPNSMSVNNSGRTRQLTGR